METKKYEISRFAPDGNLECEGEFIISNNQPFYIEKSYLLGYLSHCGKVNIIQNEIKIELKRIRKYSVSSEIELRNEVAFKGNSNKSVSKTDEIAA